VTLLMALFDESHGGEGEEMDRSMTEAGSTYWWRRQDDQAPGCQTRHREGDACPSCGEGELSYDSLFILSCPRCDYVAESGAFT